MDKGITATIATSLMPKRIEVQQAAIKSWQKLGFKVISVNVEAELSILSPLFEGVDFVPAVKSGIPSPLIPITELFQTLKKLPSDICGIVNSDIIINTEADFIPFIWQQTRDKGLLFGPRIDVDDITSQSGSTSLGYDYFFFHRGALDISLYGDFTLGATWWDYWFPVSLALNGIRLRYLLIPVGYHLRHSPGWNEKDLARGKRKFNAAITETWRRSSGFSALSATSNALIGTNSVNTFARQMPSAILLESDMVIHTHQAVPIERLPLIINTFRSHMELYETVFSSRSWRWTEPARILSNRLHVISQKIKKVG